MKIHGPPTVKILLKARRALNAVLRKNFRYITVSQARGKIYKISKHGVHLNLQPNLHTLTYCLPLTLEKIQN